MHGLGLHLQTNPVLARGAVEIFTVETLADSGSSLSGLSFEAADQAGSVLFFLDPGVQEVTEIDLNGQNGAAFATGSTGLYFSISLDDVTYGVWFNTGTETTPGVFADAEVTIFAGDPVTAVRAALANSLQGLGFEIVSQSGEVLTVRSPVKKNEVDADAGSSGFLLTVTDGVDAPPPPPPMWDRTVGVFFEANDTDAIMASRIVTALAGDSGFTASAAGNVVTITNKVAGARADAADVSSGFTITTIKQGFDS